MPVSLIIGGQWGDEGKAKVVDYLARDFTSLRGALLDYASQRYPDWTEKIEADVGVSILPPARPWPASGSWDSTDGVTSGSPGSFGG